MADPEMPPEVRSLGRTLRRWRDHIVAWHQAKVTNGPTESIILWSADGGVADVAEGVGAGGGRRVLWSVSLKSTT